MAINITKTDANISKKPISLSFARKIIPHTRSATAAQTIRQKQYATFFLQSYLFHL
jgi:hypothetical protein